MKKVSEKRKQIWKERSEESKVALSLKRKKGWQNLSEEKKKKLSEIRSKNHLLKYSIYLF